MATIENAPDVRSVHIDLPDEELADLRRRIAATRWPEAETVADGSQGVQLATMQELVRYWGTEYDFGRLETRLNAFPHFITEIDGLDIHFIHVRSPHENALPLIITHGWPGSIVEMLNVIGPLADPTAHGGYRLGPGTHRGCLDYVDEASRIHTIRRARRRLGCTDHGCDGCKGAPGAARHPLQHARHSSTRRCEGALLERPRGR